MAKKNTISKNTDLASGFFSNPKGNKETPAETPAGGEKIVAPAQTPAPEPKGNDETDTEEKNIGGRPTKSSQNKLKNIQFTMTMNPELFEQIKMIAAERTGDNVSALIVSAIKSYCKNNDINLEDYKVKQEILDKYMDKQNAKSKKKK